MKRVVITGLGIVSPLGDKDNLWDSLLKGISGIDQINRFDASALSVRIGAEVRDFDPTLFMERKDARRMDRFAQFAVAAAKMGWPMPAGDTAPKPEPSWCSGGFGNWRN